MDGIAAAYGDTEWHGMGRGHAGRTTSAPLTWRAWMSCLIARRLAGPSRKLSTRQFSPGMAARP